MEKINLEKTREYLAALNTELGVKTFNEDVINRLGDYVDEYIRRQLDNINFHNYLHDLQFSIDYNNQVVLDDFYVESDDVADELDACGALEYAIDKYEAEEKAKKQEEFKEVKFDDVEKLAEQSNDENPVTVGDLNNAQKFRTPNEG